MTRCGPNREQPPLCGIDQEFAIQLSDWHHPVATWCDASVRLVSRLGLERTATIFDDVCVGCSDFSNNLLSGTLPKALGKLTNAFL